MLVVVSSMYVVYVSEFSYEFADLNAAGGMDSMCCACVCMFVWLCA